MNSLILNCSLPMKSGFDGGSLLLSLDASPHTVSRPGKSVSYTLKIVGLSVFFEFPCSVVAATQFVGTRRNVSSLQHLQCHQAVHGQVTAAGLLLGLQQPYAAVLGVELWVVAKKERCSPKWQA